MHLGQVTRIPTQNPTCDCCDIDFHQWKEVSDLNIEFKLADMYWSSETEGHSFSSYA